MKPDSSLAPLEVNNPPGAGKPWTIVTDRTGFPIGPDHTEAANSAFGDRADSESLNARRRQRQIPPVDTGRSRQPTGPLVPIRPAGKTIMSWQATTTDYWNEARRPLACLLFLMPWIATYEAGVLVLADEQPDRLRNGADYWMRSLLSAAGLGHMLLLPILVIAVLLTWHMIRRHPWRVRLETQIGMLAESFLLAVALIVVGQVHQLLFVRLQSGSPETDARLLTLATGKLSRAISFIGAGVYEEVMFRLLLVPAAYFAFRLLECSPRFAATMAAVTTALLFALAHHVGPAADAFNLFVFTFRVAAGTFFAAVFFLRGFGITVGCHAAYDLLVGVLLVLPNVDGT